MNMDTMIAHDLEVTDSLRSYDAAIKRLLAHKPFLARIMKECMLEYRDSSIDDIINLYIEGEPQVGHIGVDVDETNPRIAGMNTEDTTLTEGTIYYDIRFNALAPKGEELIRIIINVEAQNDSHPGYSLLKRAIYYCSRMISAQKGVEFKKSDYDRIKKVYSVWICPNVSDEEKDTITAYAMKELPMVGSVSRKPEEYDLLSVVMICLGDVEDAPENGLLGMLEVLLKGQWTAAQRKNFLETDYGIQMTERLEKEVNQMCNLSQGVYENGLKQGMAKGVAQGMSQGKTQGIEQARTESLRALMTNMSISLEVAMKMLNYPISERDKYASALS